VTSREAVQKLVAYTDTAAGDDELAQAAKIVLQNLKERVAVAESLSRMVERFLELGDKHQPAKEESLFADLPPQPGVYRHPEAPGRN